MIPGGSEWFTMGPTCLRGHGQDLEGWTLPTVQLEQKLCSVQGHDSVKYQTL